MISEKHFEDLDHSSVKLRVTVNSGDVRKVYNDELGKYRNDVQLPGFRKGKAPDELLVRKFGVALKQGAALSLVEQSLAEALKDSSRAPVSQPSLESLPDMDPDAEFSFTVTYDVFPEFSVPDIGQISATRVRTEITESDEQRELEKLRDRNAVFLDKPDGVVDGGSNVTVNLVELDSEGNALEETRRNDFVLQMGQGPGPYGLSEHLEGMKKGDKRRIEVDGAGAGGSSGAEPEDGQDAQGQQDGQGQQDRRLLEVEIAGVRVKDLPDLDNEFARDVSEELKTLDDLRQKIRKELQDNADSRIRARLVNSITESMVTASDIAVPVSMIDEDLQNTWKGYVQRSGVEEDVLLEALDREGSSKNDILEGWKADSERSVRARLLFGKLVEEQGIEVTDDETAEELNKRAEEYKLPVSELEKIFGGDQFRQRVRSELVQEKLFDYLIQTAKVESGEKIDYLELIEEQVWK